MTPRERFWAKVNRTESCWLWTAGVNQKGYGRLAVNGRAVKAHRFSYMINKGPIPAGLGVLHRCDTPRCVNPEHLFLGTNDDNTKDAKSKGRNAKGERHISSKLTREQVKEMRSMYATGKYTQSELGRRYGVHSTAARLILIGRNWSCAL